MNYDLKYWKNYFEKEMESNLDVNKNILKVLLVNSTSDDALFNYYNFDNLKETVAFMREVILPSTVLSMALVEYEHIVAGAMDRKTCFERLESINASNDIIRVYDLMYDEITELLEQEKLEVKDVLQIAESLNDVFSTQNSVFLILEFSTSVDVYLKDIYYGYKNSGKIAMLKETLAQTDFNIEHLVEFMNDINAVDIDLLEEFLYQIAVI